MADFSSFQQAVQKAELSLKSFETGAGKVEKALGKMGDSFSGRKVIQDAELMAKAIGEIGGASRLTESEQRRVNSAITEALAKYKALGLEAPKAMTDLANATAKVEEGSGFFHDLSANVQATALGFISAQAVMGAVSSGIGALTGFVRDSVQAYAESEAAQKKLSAALIAQGPAAAGAASQYRALASEFASTTTHGDDLITEMEALLVQVGGVLPGEMRGALKAATDLSAGLGIDLETATRAVGKAFEGEVGALKKFGIEVDGARLKAEGMPAVLGAIEARVGGQAQAALNTYAGRLAKLADAWGELQEATGETLVANPIVEAALRRAQSIIEGNTRTVDDHEHSWSRLLRRMSVFGENAPNLVARFVQSIEDTAAAGNRAAASKFFSPEFLKPMASHLDASAVAAQRLREEQRREAEAAEAVADAMKRAQAAAKAHTDAIVGLRDELSGRGAIKAATDMAEALRGLPPVQRLTTESQQRINKAMEDALDVYRAQGIAAPKAIRDIAAATFDYAKLVPDIKEGAAGFEAVGRQAKLAVPEVIALYGAIRDGMPKVVPGLDNVTLPGKVDLEKIKKSMGLDDRSAEQAGLAFGRKLSQSIVSAVQGGGNVGAAIGASIGEEIGTSLGKKLAKKLGGELGGAIGGALGPLGAVGGELLGGLVGKLFGKGEGRSMVEDFAKQFGGFSQLNQKLVGLGQAEYDRLWKLLNTVGKNNTDQAKRAIDEVTAALERQNAELHKTAPTFADASAAAEALGLDINRIGDGINQLRVSDTAKDIAAQWGVLRDAGANMEEVATGAAGKFQKLVDEALKWGHTLPEEMREPLQKMIDLGLLTDKSGDKLEDLSGIKWAEPMEKAVDRLIGKMDQLIDRIGNGLGGALSSLPDSIGDGITRTDNRGRVDVENSFANGTGGFKWFGSGTRATLHGWEAVIRPSDVRQGGSGQSAGTVIVHVGTRELVRTLMPEIAGEVKRLRLGA